MHIFVKSGENEKNKASFNLLVMGKVIILKEANAFPLITQTQAFSTSRYIILVNDRLRIIRFCITTISLSIEGS